MEKVKAAEAESWPEDSLPDTVETAQEEQKEAEPTIIFNENIPKRVKRQKAPQEQDWSSWAWDTSTMLVPPWEPTLKRGKKEEVKVLETKDRMTIRREIILVRRFLKMSVDSEDIKIYDERPGRAKLEEESKKMH